MGRIGELLAMLRSRRVGFKADERMKGSHRFLVDLPDGNVRAGDELPFSFKITWGNPLLFSFLNPLSAEHGLAPLEGWVTVGGVVGEAPIRGAMELRYFKDATIRYTFEFSTRGQRYRFKGGKQDIRPWNLHRTHTICRGILTDLTSGEDLSEVTVRFALRTMPQFLASFRLA
jgi:hypothetical protein